MGLHAVPVTRDTAVRIRVNSRADGLWGRLWAGQNCMPYVALPCRPQLQKQDILLTPRVTGSLKSLREV